jgi:two-component system sensor kinase FixL
MTGVPAADAIGKPLANVILLIDSQSEQPINIGQNWSGEALLVNASGDRIPVSASIANIAADGGPSLGQVLVLRDIRVRQWIAEFRENQRVQNIIEEVSEAERRRFGQDLHDGLGQALTGATFLCKRLEEHLSGESRPEGLEAARIGEILATAIESARDMSRGLLPVPDQPDGLAIALERLVEQIVTQFEIECDFIDASAVPVSNPMVANHLFRICQEAVNNAVKHAAPRRIDIHLQTENGSGILTIGDDGSGIDGQLDGRGSGFGIMRRRAATIGGALKVVANEGGGTLVVCSFSLEPQ